LLLLLLIFSLRKKKALSLSHSLILCGNEKALELEAQYKHSHLNGQRCGTGYLFLSLLSFPFLLSEDTLSLLFSPFSHFAKRKKNVFGTLQIRVCVYLIARISVDTALLIKDKLVL
jgi:hypothetical protein